MNCWVVKFIILGVFLNAFLVALALLPLYLIKKFVDPIPRGFDPADNSIALSIKSNTVSSNAATWGTAFLAAGVIALIEVILAYCRQRRVFQSCDQNTCSEAAAEKFCKEDIEAPSEPTPKQIWLNTLFVIWLLWVLLLVGCGITGTATNLGKMLVARPRPCFLQFCQPDYTVMNVTECNKCGSPRNPGTNWPLCPTCPFIDGPTAENRVCNPLSSMKPGDMWKSFPSGHSSYSMYACVYLAVYLYSRMRESDLISRYLVALHPLVIFATMLFGIFSSLSRVSDHRHHLSDVIAGALLGSFIGLVLSATVALPVVQRIKSNKLFYCNMANCGRNSKCRNRDAESSPNTERLPTFHNTNESF